MTDLTELGNDAMSVLGKGSGEARTAERLGPGLVHVDYADPDAGFLVEITRVPTRRLLPDPWEVGVLNGVSVHLRDVVSDDRISVVLEGRPVGSEEPHRAGASWPGEDLMRVGLSLSDDAGTVYQPWTAEAGGEDHPWRAVRRSRPALPAEASAMHLELTIE